MAYNRTNWQDLPNQTTPINATNLNKIEQGIYDATYVNGVNVGSSVDSDYKVNFIKGKNLMQIKTIASTTISGITYSISNDGTITLNGTANARMEFSYLLEPLKSFANEYYCLSYIYISGALTDGSVSVNNQDGNHNLNGYNIELTTSNYSSNKGDLKSMQTDLNMNGAAIIRVGNGSVLNNLKFKLMFVKSRVRDYNYEPYVTPSINVDGEEIYSKDNLEQYSTSEIKIGTWIDGKPLYRRVITSTNLNVNTNNNISISNYSGMQIKRIYGYNLAGGSNFVADINCLTSGSSEALTNFRTSCYYNGNGILLSYCGSYLTGNNKYDTYITLEYTKTTDTATRSLNAIEQTRSIPTESTEDDER